MIWTTAKFTDVNRRQTAIPARAGRLGAAGPGVGRSIDRRAVRVATGRRSYTGLRHRPGAGPAPVAERLSASRTGTSA